MAVIDELGDQRCDWVNLGRYGRGMGYDHCPGYVMTYIDGVGLCQYHFKLWNQYERARLQSEGKLDPWQEDEETKFEPPKPPKRKYRRNADRNLRELERLWQAGLIDERSYVIAALRAGKDPIGLSKAIKRLVRAVNIFPYRRDLDNLQHRPLITKIPAVTNPKEVSNMLLPESDLETLEQTLHGNTTLVSVVKVLTRIQNRAHNFEFYDFIPPWNVEFLHKAIRGVARAATRLCLIFYPGDRIIYSYAADLVNNVANQLHECLPVDLQQPTNFSTPSSTSLTNLRELQFKLAHNLQELAASPQPWQDKPLPYSKYILGRFEGSVANLFREGDDGPCDDHRDYWREYWNIISPILVELRKVRF